jgi:hypothetical protein
VLVRCEGELKLQGAAAGCLNAARRRLEKIHQQYRNQQYRGAEVFKVWEDEVKDGVDLAEIGKMVYISFGEYLEDEGTDSYGVPDDDIFHYAEDPDELKTYLKPGAHHDGWFLTEINLIEA